jgi:CheY-like chemotaxis protein
VVWNLLSNAIKFTPPQGRIELSLQQTAAMVEITVRDNGEGISADFLPHVFEPLRQADSSTTRAVGGLGLGLAIARRLVEQHGGELRAASDGPGRGACFTMLLPKDGAPQEPPEPAAAAPSSAFAAGDPAADGAEEPDLSGKRILVVDDEPDAAELARLLLGGRGADTKTAGSVGEALRQLAAERFHLVLADIGMAGRDGYDLLRAVRADSAQYGTPAAVAVTAFASAGDRARALDAGFHAHVSKPFDRGQLFAAVHGLLLG